MTQEYAIQVRAMLKHAKVRRAALLVVTDADQQKVSERMRELRNNLPSSAISSADADPIFHWIPKWHIESWILSLCGEAVDESENLKNLYERKKPTVKTAAEAFVQRVHSPISEDSTQLPSLHLGLEAARELQNYLKSKG